MNILMKDGQQQYLQNRSLLSVLIWVNPFVHHVHILGQLNPVHCPNATLTLVDSGSAKIAAVMDYDNITQDEVWAHTIVISCTNGWN